MVLNWMHFTIVSMNLCDSTAKKEKPEEVKEDISDNRNIAEPAKPADGHTNDKLINNEPIVRHHFPETWIWRDVFSKYATDKLCVNFLSWSVMMMIKFINIR